MASVISLPISPRPPATTTDRHNGRGVSSGRPWTYAFQRVITSCSSSQYNIIGDAGGTPTSSGVSAPVEVRARQERAGSGDYVPIGPAAHRGVLVACRTADPGFVPLWKIGNTLELPWLPWIKTAQTPYRFRGSLEPSHSTSTTRSQPT